MFSAGCTMNIGSKKLLREVASTFCGAQRSIQPEHMGRVVALPRSVGCITATNDGPPETLPLL